MKKSKILLFLLMMTMWSFAEDVKITQVMTDGTEVVKYYPADIEKIVIFDSYKNSYQTQEIRGLENLKNLKVLEFQTLPSLKNYNFLKEMTSVEDLYFDRVYFSDFSLLTNMTKLKAFKHRGYIANESVEKIYSEGLDFSFCPNLELLTLDPWERYFEFVPDIKVSSDKVWLRMENQPVTRNRMSKREKKIIERFLKVTLFHENAG
ncbi:hypothetical protein [Treponema lecithinolyticum]|jgi:hypothetical protein|uniref:Leucine Rich repeat-containing domain protein n=1 Tax=Treponema lecithinolyticum ATCC 700332 TaxID=1321815 RepID=A0ABN0NW31_TRELE|nr:hypothetical protein [Treponema lecithinolyticum]ERJ91494.1 hypothetical protein HMPREF9193_02195 [Treponema lecithinolyticum ATCC 700332]